MLLREHGRLIRLARVWEIVSKLFKVRIVGLLLWEALAGALLAAPSWRGIAADILAVMISGALAAGGASAINEYLERDLDAQMHRTRNRPLPKGDVAPWVALLLGLVALALGIGLAFGYRWELGWFVTAGAFIYLVIYTIGLKRRSVLNIVIGGAAGSCAALSGAAAVGHWNAPATWILAGLIFLWTPSHFWSLALAFREDYRMAGFPMLPAVTSPRAAAGWILLHAAATALAALSLAPFLRFGVAYLVGVLALSVWMLRSNLHLLTRQDRDAARRAFVASNLYLTFVTLLAMLMNVRL